MPSSPSPRRTPSLPAAAAPRPVIAIVITTAIAGFAALALALVPACGSDTDPRCDQSFLRYDNFGSPFIANWCRPCHSIELPPGMRQGAPADVNFDTLDEVHAWSTRIKLTAGDSLTATMPPAGGPSESERAMLVEWLRCGAR